MTIKPLRSDDDLRLALKQLEATFQAPEGSAGADERDVLVTLIEAYEQKHCDFGPVDPVEAIKFRMEQDGLSPRDLEPYIDKVFTKGAFDLVGSRQKRVDPDCRTPSGRR